MSSVFYERFERHDKATGLKAHGTHYCAGCGHGLIHRYLADAIEKLGIQDRTVAISPVGCGVFLYYYMDVGNTAAAHGRASAVAVGQKLANPDAVVFAYQGDGDFGAIGLLEGIYAAQLGIPIAVIFVNNAVYGMTGGQLAPTTLMAQKTSTSPLGRDLTAGTPLKLAEMIASIDGPVYVERVALFDAKQRRRAAKAIEKALTLQRDNAGYAFVEVLAECPTHLKLTPTEAERWVEEKMLPVFPLGVKKDLPPSGWAQAFRTPSFDPERALAAIGAGGEAPPRYAQGLPAAFGDDVGIKVAGAGGDGAQTAAYLLARTAVNEGFDATHIPSYGPESRGGTSFADVRIAKGEVLSPDASEPHVLVAFNAPSLARFGPAVRRGGVVVFDRSVIRDPPALDPSVRVVAVPATEIARELGQPLAKNVVALGALVGATGLLPEESVLAALRQALAGKRGQVSVNEEAFRRGLAAGRGGC
ncbi:MAG TPA: 2-oxoacid:acceptor oxidoreductase family protein [Anaeromyxobacter sp.]